MQNPDILVQRAMESLEVAESSGLEFVECHLAEIAGKHWRGHSQAIVPVRTGSPESVADSLEPVQASLAPDATLGAPEDLEAPVASDAVSALAAKFKTPKIEAAKSTQPARIAQTTQNVKEVEHFVAPSVDKAVVEQLSPVDAPSVPVRVEKTQVDEVAASVPVPAARTVDTVIDVGKFGSGTIPVESPDVPLPKKKKKRKVKKAKAAETGSAMSWTMRR